MVDQATYTAQGRDFLARAHVELAAGDLRQAAEKGWGAAAQVVKAAAESFEWPHYSHGQLLRVASLLTEMTGDMELSVQFRSAQALHTHFYEGNLNPDEVAHCLDDTTRFVARVEALLPEG